jgi:hypothetical protein
MDSDRVNPECSILQATRISCIRDGRINQQEADSQEGGDTGGDGEKVSIMGLFL